MGFRKDFVWGVSTAAYQIEGAAFEDGRKESVWDMMCRKPGAVWRGHTGAVACDHYHRYPEDVGLMKRLGVQAYRFSISWPRVLPDGIGAVNAKGLEFYDRLVDALLGAGIDPYVTLFHWDFPVELYHRGGWLNRDSADWFADYTTVVVDRLSDRVSKWMTLNEPQCYIGLGLKDGVHAPGDRLALREVLQAGHHTLLAHGKAVQTIRARSKLATTVGYAPVGCAAMPASNDPQDIEAARAATHQVRPGVLFNNAWWMDPVILGGYPEEGLRAYGPDAPAPRSGDMETMCQKLDFLGINTYFGTRVQAGPNGEPVEVGEAVGSPLTAFRWSVTPDALYWTPKFLYERYGVPIVMTENGTSCNDWVALDGKVHDPNRIDYLHRYIREFRRAADDGVDVRGYFQWSLLDNFEWGEGYKERFGLVFVDYTTQERIPKDSFEWYRQTIAANGDNL